MVGHLSDIWKLPSFTFRLQFARTTDLVIEVFKGNAWTLKDLSEPPVECVLMQGSSIMQGWLSSRDAETQYQAWKASLTRL